jgi:mitochondrial enoyl-[acyl-carrier protein] reductase / trans-2-enoyl-CoA reductase
LAAEGADLDGAAGPRSAVRRSRRRIADGTLRVEVEATYPIEEIKAALAHAERAGRSGKILVLPNGPVG